MMCIHCARGGCDSLGLAHPLIGRPARPVHALNTFQTTALRLAVLPHRPCASLRAWAPCEVLQVSPAKARPPALPSLFFLLQLFTAADVLTQLLDGLASYAHRLCARVHDGGL